MVKENDDIPLNKTLIGRIKHLDESAQKKLENANFLIKLMTLIRSFFGNLSFNRTKAFEKIEFPGKNPVTSRGEFRLLKLKSDQGGVYCRVRGEPSGRLPRLSREKVVECSARTNLRLQNLVAVRGNEPGTRMIGPCDYFGNIESPDQYKFTIEIDENRVPIILIQDKPGLIEDISSTKTEQIEATTVKVSWCKGTTKGIEDVKARYSSDKPAVGESLFPNSGILEIEGISEIILTQVQRLPEVNRCEVLRFDTTS